MTRDEITAALARASCKRVRVTWHDGVVQWVDVHSVDDEGVLHSGPEGVEPAYYSSRHDGIMKIETS